VGWIIGSRLGLSAAIGCATFPISDTFRQHYDPSCYPTHIVLRNSYHVSSLFFQTWTTSRYVGYSQMLPNTAIPDAMSSPFPAPELRGRLSLGWFSHAETWTHLTTSCGGLRFRRMEPWKSARCASVLLEVCAKTLEILRFHATDRSRSKSFCLDLSTDSS